MKILFVCVAVGLLAGCAGAQLNKTQEDYVVSQTIALFGNDAPYLIFSIKSHGWLADATFNTQSVTQGPSGVAYQLADKFAEGVTKDTYVAVTGPNPSKNAQVIKDAFKVCGAQLPRLKLLFFGTPEQSAGVEKVAQKYGAQYYFAEFQSSEQRRKAASADQQ